MQLLYCKGVNGYTTLTIIFSAASYIIGKNMAPAAILEINSVMKVPTKQMVATHHKLVLV